MFTFKKEMLEAVLSGRKTRTWRPLKERQEVEGDKVVATHHRAPHRRTTLHAVGKTEAIVPKRGCKNVGKLVVMKITACTPNDATEADALAEGFGSVAEFHNYLCEVVYPDKDRDRLLKTPGYATDFHLAYSWVKENKLEATYGK